MNRKFRSLNGKNRVLRQFLITYVIVFIVPLLICSIYFFKVIRMLGKDDLNFRQAELEHAADQIDNFHYFIFFDKSNLVINDRDIYTWEDFFDLYLRVDQDLTYEQWRETMTETPMTYGVTPKTTYIYRNKQKSFQDYPGGNAGNQMYQWSILSDPVMDAGMFSVTGFGVR